MKTAQKRVSPANVVALRPAAGVRRVGRKATPGAGAPAAALPKAPGAAVVRISRVTSKGSIYVELHGDQGDKPRAVLARSTVRVGASDVDRLATVLFESGDASKPIIIGLLEEPSRDTYRIGGESVEVEADGEIIRVTAGQKLVLRCGKASLTLTRAGKIILSGTYLSNKSTGVNRIQGGSVQIN